MKAKFSISRIFIGVPLSTLPSMSFHVIAHAFEVWPLVTYNYLEAIHKYLKKNLALPSLLDENLHVNKLHGHW